MVIWTDEEMPNSYEWRATKVKLEQSSIATTWKSKSYASELAECNNRLYINFNNAYNFRSNASDARLAGAIEYPYQIVPPTITVYALDDTVNAITLATNANVSQTVLINSFNAGSMFASIQNDRFLFDFQKLGYADFVGVKFIASSEL